MYMLKVEGSDSLVRDPVTNAIINTNESEYIAYTARQAIAQQRKQQINNQTKELENIKQEMSEIRSMLSALLTKGK
jgi:hypothetical protein